MKTVDPSQSKTPQTTLLARHGSDIIPSINALKCVALDCRNKQYNLLLDAHVYDCHTTKAVAQLRNMADDYDQVATYLENQVKLRS